MEGQSEVTGGRVVRVRSVVIDRRSREPMRAF